MADAVRRRMAHHANAAVGRRVLLVRLAEEERLAVPLLVEADADAAGEENELGAEPGRPPCRERRAADTMMSIDYVAMKESRGRDRPTVVRRLVFTRAAVIFVSPNAKNIASRTSKWMSHRWRGPVFYFEPSSCIASLRSMRG